MKLIMKGVPKNWSGAGDAVESLTEVTGVKKIVEAVSKRTGRPCGCAKRKEALNKRFPFKKEGGEDNE